jgi:ceramide glucosyltransferase
MSGNVDEAEPYILRKLEMSEAEVDGDAAALLFGEAVGVDSGEGADQRGLAVVDVTGGAYDNVSHVRVLKYFYIAPLLALLTGSWVYCAIALVAAWRYRQSGAARLAKWPPVSVLRPLAGAEDNTEANLRSAFAQEYPAFEVLLSVHEEDDPAAAIARRVMADYPAVPARLIVAGVSPLPNAKVWSLRALMPEARHEHVAMTDSDIRLEPDCLATVISELAQPGVGLVTCPYRAAGGPRFWPRVEALGLNTDFLAGMLTQRFLNGMDFAIGCTIATRKAELEAIGGLPRLQRYLAEDFAMGNLMHDRGRTVVLSRSVIEHHIGNDGFVKNWRHRLRWARSTRRSRRMGYVGEIFTKPVALGLMVWIAAPSMWWGLAAAVVLRAAVAWSMAGMILRDPSIARCWWMLPVEDVASFATWVLGFFGKTILWRGRKLVVARDGSFEG